jgi:CheY-like chemotaxis protein
MMAQIALLVDDEQPLRTYLSEVLRLEGFAVLEAVDGLDALSLLRSVRGNVDLLITDINMPRMNGIELVQAVKAEFPDIPVVYISALGLRDGLHDPRKRMVFLQKPFAPQAIREAVRVVTGPNGTAGRAS